MNKNILLYIIIGIFLISFISAEGFTIEPLNREVIKLSTPVSFDFHVINTSNGFPITFGTSCDFHLYDSLGTHLTSLHTNAVSSNYDYNFNVDKYNLTQVGDYSYIVSCNSSVQGGMISRAIKVTGTGVLLTIEKMLLYGLLFFLLLVFLVIDILVIPMLPSKDNYDEEGVLISINQLKYLRPVLYLVAYLLILALMFIGSNVAIAYMTEKLFGNLLFAVSRIMLGFLLPIIVVWLIYIFHNVFQDKEMKTYIERGVIN